MWEYLWRRSYISHMKSIIVHSKFESTVVVIGNTQKMTFCWKLCALIKINIMKLAFAVDELCFALLMF